MINVYNIIKGVYVVKIVSFKYYMEEICDYKVTKSTGFNSENNIYQSGYFYNSNRGWLHISDLGTPQEIKMSIREHRINSIIND